MSPRGRPRKPSDPKGELDKLWKTEEWKKFDKLLKNVTLNPIKNPLSIEEPIFLKTNTILDSLFGGGIRQGQLVELYGEFASGKTQICFSLVVESNGKIVYIDSEHTFSPQRIKQIAEARGKKETGEATEKNAVTESMVKCPAQWTFRQDSASNP